MQYSDNVMEYIHAIRKAGIVLQEVYAEAVNDAGKVMIVRYKKSLLSSKRLRNRKFTLGAVVLLQAHARHRTEKTKLREMGDINAIVGVRQLRDGEHYLGRMEIGGLKKGSNDTHGRASIPMDTARGGDRNRPILPKNRLSKAKPQLLDARNMPPDPRQDYAVLYSLAKHGKIQPGVYQTRAAIYNVTRKKVTMIRKVRNSVKIKAQPLFRNATDKIKSIEMERFFIRAAKRRLSSITKTS